MKSNEGKIEIIIVLFIITISMMITSSVVLVFKSFGKEKIIYTLENLGIIKSIVGKNEKINNIKEEIYEIPYLKASQREENDSIKNLNQEEKIIYYRIKKVVDLNNQEILAIIYLMKKLDFRYDYFIAALTNNKYQTFITIEDIYPLVYPKYKDIMSIYLRDKSDEYKQVYIKGLYFHYLSNLYGYDLNRLFTEYNMGSYESEEYYRRNGSYMTYFASDSIQNIKIYEDIYRYYLKSII